MIYYFAILLIPLLVSFSRQKPSRKTDFWLAAYFIVLLAFVGLRDHVGSDWQAYEWNYIAAETESWGHLLEHREPGFFVLNKISALMGWGVYGVNFICALLFLSGLYMYARETRNPWLAVAVVVPYLVFIVGMSGIRQAAAIGLMLHMLATWNVRGVVYKVGLILVAMSIHNSAILLFSFLVFRNDRYLLLRLLGCGVLALLSANAISESAAYERYNQAYIERNVESVGALIQVGLSTFPSILYLLFRRQIRVRCGTSQQIELGVLMASVAILLVPLSTTGVSRAALYLSFVQMWVYPAFAYSNSNRMFANFMIGMLCLSIFFVYFFMGTHAFAYLPYRTVMG